jgi:hypothetical protein
MSTRINPFHAYLGSGKRRTLAEIEAANHRPNAFQTRHWQPAQPVRGLVRERVSEWLSHQEVHLGREDFVELNWPSAPDSFRRTPDSVRDGGNGPISPPTHRQLVQAGATVKPFRPAPHTPSSQNFSSTGLKRKASDLDDSEDVMIVQPPPSALRRLPKTTAFIDLTRGDGEKRRTSFRGHRDDDVVIVDPPAAEMRRQLRPLLLGRPRGSNTRAENIIRASPAACRQSRPPLVGMPRNLNTRAQKRPKQTHTREAPALQRLLQRSSEGVADAAVVPEADVTEASVLLQNIEPVTGFFTLPTEIRDKIYRHLLVSQQPITVQGLWAELARRSTRRGRSGNDIGNTIDTEILSVCRRTALEGTRVLYSENSFFYMLRDSDVAVAGGSSGVRGITRVPPRRREQERRTIDLEKYGHLIRHMAIELEPNRTGTESENLMSAALEILCPVDPGSPRHSSSPQPLCVPIHLHTLTITVSPLFQPSHRTIRAAAQGGNQDTIMYDGRFLSVVGFFSRGARVLKALQRLNVDFLRINVHVNSDVINSRSGSANQNTADSDSGFSDDFDSDEYDSDDSAASTVQAQKQRRHLETTIDLRYLPRHMDTLRREGPLGHLWETDELMRAKRVEQAMKADSTLASLRRHIEEACTRPESALRGGIWEDHGAAERRRREKRAKDEARFDADAVDRSYGDGRIVRGMKSLIISIDRVGDELRAYRA